MRESPTRVSLNYSLRRSWGANTGMEATMTRTSTIKTAQAASVAVALLAGVPQGAIAAPLGTNAAGIKQAIESPLVDVRWRRGGYVAAGVLGGLALGGALYGQRYYDDGRYYNEGPYGQVYYNDYDEGPIVVQPAPTVQYYAPAYNRQSCWVVTDSVRDQGYLAC
jgi:hypothetical protein